MNNLLDDFLRKRISPDSVKLDGQLTLPRSWGVYDLGATPKGVRRFRFGNYPIRQIELQAEFGQCNLYSLFGDRDAANKLANILNQRRMMFGD